MQLIDFEDPVLGDEEFAKIQQFFQLSWLSHISGLKAIVWQQLSNWLVLVVFLYYEIVGRPILQDNIGACALVADSHKPVRQQVPQYPFMAKTLLYINKGSFTPAIEFRLYRFL